MTDSDAILGPEGYGEDDNGQLQQEDTLIEPAGDDKVDEGYEPPQQWSAAERHGNTVDEQREGETLDQRLAQERPDEPAGGLQAREAGAEGTTTSVDEDAERLVEEPLAENNELDAVIDEDQL